MENINTFLVKGDPLEISESTDLLAQLQNLPVAELPVGTGWRILTGNHHTNMWARVVTRYELHEEEPSDYDEEGNYVGVVANENGWTP